MGRKILAFEKKHMIGILLFIRSMKGCTRMELYEGVANNDRMPDKLAVLEGYGLITQTVVPATRAVRIELTEKGEEVSSKFLEIEKMLS